MIPATYLTLKDFGRICRISIPRQGNTTDDGDPSEEVGNDAPTQGETLKTANGFSTVYIESTREYSHPLIISPASSVKKTAQNKLWEQIQGVVAHEIAHAPPGDSNDNHKEGGLIGKGVTEINTRTFNPITIKRFRRTFSWRSHP